MISIISRNQSIPSFNFKNSPQSFEGWGDKMFFPTTGPFNSEQQKVIKEAKKFSKKGIRKEEAIKLLNEAEKVKLSHRGPEVHKCGKTAGQEHVHVLGKHIFLTA